MLLVGYFRAVHTESMFRAHVVLRHSTETSKLESFMCESSTVTSCSASLDAWQKSLSHLPIRIIYSTVTLTKASFYTCAFEDP
jgi:hypothetical protein